jgi:uncharacterized caspase-like protein
MRRFRHALSLSSYVLLLVLLAHPADAERRVALIVGNGTYQHASTLPNASTDAKAMAALLRNVGFEVTEGVDLKREGTMARLSEFAAKTQGADVALLYYSGHGIAVDGKNFMVPVDTELNSELDVKLGAAIDVEVAVDQIMAGARVKLVFLDACRDNPFTTKIRAAARTRSVTILSGLAEMKPNEGTLIAFVAGPGQTALDGKPGENSPFTRALLSHVAEPGVEIRQALTEVRAQVSRETNKEQLAWENTNLTGFFYVNQQGTTAATTARIGAPGAAAVPFEARSNTWNEVELEFWRSVRTSDKAQEYSAYLARFPNGNFVSIARVRRAALQTNVQSINPALPTRETEEQLGLDQLKRSDIQRRLFTLGYFDGAAMVTSTTTRGARLSVGRLHGATWRVAISTNCNMRRCLLSAFPLSDRPSRDNCLRHSRNRSQPGRRPPRRLQRPRGVKPGGCLPAHGYGCASRTRFLWASVCR